MGDTDVVTSCAIGIDVGGTNTDAVILGGDRVRAWHKTPTTADIQTGVEHAIYEVIKKAAVPPTSVRSLKIGTTQFINAVLEEDASKLDKVAVIRLCGPYSRGSPPFADFPPRLRRLVEGHFAYVDGGYQVHGQAICELDRAQLDEQISIFKSKRIRAIIVVGIYSPSDPSQEEDAASYLASRLGSDFDISCSHRIGTLGFLERENATILNASLRRFARHVIHGFEIVANNLGDCRLYITLNDGTLSASSEASYHPVRCFSSGPTNSARGGAFLASHQLQDCGSGDIEVLVVDVGGTTTDVCALLKSGFPRQSAAFVKIAGVRTNFTIPDVQSIALGGGSIVREHEGRSTVGPDSVGYRLEKESLCFGGSTMTATDLAISNAHTASISPRIKEDAIYEIRRVIELAIDQAKTKAGDATVILVGGGSIVLPSTLSGISQLIRPTHFEVANAVGAAIGKISGAVDRVVVPGEKTVEEQLEEAKTLALEKCILAGGKRETAEVVEVDIVPISYVTNGATRLIVRVVADLWEDDEPGCRDEKSQATYIPHVLDAQDESQVPHKDTSEVKHATQKASTYEVTALVDVITYQPNLRGDFWYLSETDLQFLQDGVGVLGVGSCGEPYPSYIACLRQLRTGKPITIRRQDTTPDDAVILAAGFMGSPTVYLERIPGEHEISNAIHAVLKASQLSSFDAIIPNEIGGINAFEALLASSRLGKSTFDADAVARAYPYLWQTVRCLNGVSIAPCAVADGHGKQRVLQTQDSPQHAEDVMRDACTKLGSLAGLCVNPIRGTDARTLPKNSFSWAWSIGQTIALSRQNKQDPAQSVVEAHNGALLFTGKITSVTRNVACGFTRGITVLESFNDGAADSTSAPGTQLVVEFENENLSAVLRKLGHKDCIMATCPDLITFLDKTNGAPLGVSDYKYGLRVSVIALRASPVWMTKEGLALGGPQAFGLDTPYVPVGDAVYKEPKSVWELFGSDCQTSQ
ncbi:hypothetical protein BCR34DRAFT_490386 [Clohesyomyces aquaticus]|uniref:Hydantoinase/oxoprolinase n=1 Tax=Clohesyomyces aquaticus TaxID=1231657 RepID=A0A1Y1Z788_9PLEO|nr:hypothetical protein BCR34DRAFT_490386 [Clohesyomyces aquaticus]